MSTTKRLLTVISMAFAIAACGDDAESKRSNNATANNANNVNNVNNQVPPGVQEFCAGPLEPVECIPGGPDEFTISFTPSADCVENRILELSECEDLTIADVSSCYEAIDACEGTSGEDFEAPCGAYFDCQLQLLESNNENNVGPNNTNNVPEPEFTEEFLQVHELITNSCAQAACHGSFSVTYSYENDGLSTPAEVQAVLESTNAISTGRPLVDPGNPEGSEIFVRLSLDPGDPEVMPQTGKLPQEQIDLVRNWIAGGAVYRR